MPGSRWFFKPRISGPAPLSTSVNQMSTCTNSRLAWFMWLATPLFVAWGQAEPAQNVVTNDEAVWFKPLQGYQWKAQALRQYPVPTGARVMVLTNSPAENDAQRRYEQ